MCLLHIENKLIRVVVFGRLSLGIYRTRSYNPQHAAFTQANQLAQLST